MSEDWKPIETAPEKTSVMTKIDDEKYGPRNEQVMVRTGNLWWIHKDEPNEMYVYYAPTHWRSLT